MHPKPSTYCSDFKAVICTRFAAGVVILEYDWSPTGDVLSMNVTSHNFNELSLGIHVCSIAHCLTQFLQFPTTKASVRFQRITVYLCSLLSSQDLSEFLGPISCQVKISAIGIGSDQKYFEAGAGPRTF